MTQLLKDFNLRSALFSFHFYMCKTHSKYFLSCFANDTNHQAESERPIVADTSQIYG